MQIATFRQLILLKTSDPIYLEDNEIIFDFAIQGDAGRVMVTILKTEDANVNNGNYPNNVPEQSYPTITGTGNTIDSKPISGTDSNRLDTL